MKKYKKVKTIDDIKNDPRIDEFIKDYDGKGKHMAACKDDWRFERDRTIDIGTVKEICNCINDWLEKDEDEA